MKFATSRKKSTFSEHILNAGHEMRPMEDTMTISNFQKNPKRINAFEEIEIMKATTSDHMLYTKQNNNPLYKILQPFWDQTAKGTLCGWKTSNI